MISDMGSQAFRLSIIGPFEVRSKYSRRVNKALAHLKSTHSQSNKSQTYPDLAIFKPFASLLCVLGELAQFLLESYLWPRTLAC